MGMFIEKIQKTFSKVNRLERKRERLVSKLEKEREKLEETDIELEEIYNTKTCDVCGKEFKLIILTSPGRCVFGGSVFSESGFEPVLFNGKLIDCVCAGCVEKQIKKEKE